MDAIDLQTIQRFADVPFAIEAPVTAADHLAKATAILVQMRSRLDQPGEIGVYRRALAEVRKQVEREFFRDDKRIEFFDLSEPDAQQEALRIDLALKGAGSGISARSRAEGPFSFEVEDVFEKPLCVIVGPDPSTTAKRYFSGRKDSQVNTSGIDDESMLRLAMWRELGRCIVGQSDDKADAFAALMAIRYLKSPRVVPMLASWREFDEMTNPSWSADRFASATLWSLNKIDAKLRKSKKFMAMGVKDIASLASEIVAEFGPGKEQRQHIRRFRAALNGIIAMKGHYLPVNGGVVTVGVERWLAARTRDIPEFDRFASVVHNLRNGPVALDPHYVDIDAFKGTLASLANEGDPTARAFLQMYDAPADTRPRHVASLAMDDRIGLRPASESEITEIIGFDERHERIAFSHDNDVWEIRNAKTGEFIKAGSVSLGCEWSLAEYPKYDPSSQMASLAFKR